MMKYINKLTGAIIETVCEISGEDWEVEADEAEKPKSKPNKKDKEE